MSRASAAGLQSEVRQRFLRAMIAVTQVAAVDARGSGELGYYIGHALSLTSGNDDLARSWLSSALSERPMSPLAFEGWLDLAQLRTRKGDHAGALEMLVKATTAATSPSQWARLALERGLALERSCQWELARREYEALLSLEVDETELSRAGWHLALVLDRLGEHANAMYTIDQAEARAYQGEVGAVVALDVTGYRHANGAAFEYAQGLKWLWVAERRDDPPSIQALQRALASFEAAQVAEDVARAESEAGHITELRRRIAASLRQRF